MADVLPKGTSHPDPYYMVNGQPGEDARTGRETIHIFSRMHIVVAYLEFFSVLMLVFVGSVYVDFWDGSYFHLGPPVVTRDVVIRGEWKYWLLITVIAWDRVFAMASSKIVSSWRVNIVLNEKSPEYKDVSYTKAMFVLCVDHAMNFLRGALMILFIYSQVDFALAFAIPDIVLGFTSTLYDIKRLQRTWADNCSRKDVRAVVVSNTMDKPLPKGVSEWQISPMVLTFLQLCEFTLFVVVFLVVGYFDSPYFEFHTPFVVFGHVFDSTVTLWMFVIFAFVDTLISTMYNFVTGAYVVSILLNPSCLDIQDTKSGATFIYISKKVIGWVRVIFMLNFILSKFVLLLAMFVADMIVSVFFFHRQLLRKSNALFVDAGGNIDINKPRNLLGYMPISRYYLTVVSLIELFIVLAVTIPVLEMYNYPYFAWPPPLVVFDTVVVSGGVCAYLIVYTIIARVIDTLSSDITYPYIANVIGGCDPNGVHYDPAELVFVCLMYDSTNWLKRIVAFNFIYSNISLVLFQAIADIAVSWIILDRNLKYKKKMLELKNSESQARLISRVTAAEYRPADVGAKLLRAQVYNSMINAENTSDMRNKDF